LVDVPASPFFHGRFGRMFRTLPAFIVPQDLINQLALTMKENVGAPAPGGADPGIQFDNPDIPAGFTYLGQFIDHDITFDPVSSLQRSNDPNALRNFRTPRLDLDSVYGNGPSDQPFLYQDSDRDKLLVGTNPPTDAAGNALEPRDLPRNQEHRALIGDKRNDENIIVSQLQLAFLDFHNQVVDEIRGGGLNACLLAHGPDTVFAEAQRLVRWHYQWMVANDFLPHIVGRELVDQLLKTEEHRQGGHMVKVRVFKPDHPLYKVKNEPYMPVEFSAAAYRYGHSQIRPEYDLNDAVQNVPIFVADPANTPVTGHLGGFRALPAQWTVDWGRFFALPGSTKGEQSRLIDTKLSDPMTDLPANIASDGQPGHSLAFFNLERGRALRLPSGQAVAGAMGHQPLDAQAIGFDGPAPLWYYVLKEAEVQHNGRHLGDVGGRIVAEVILGLIHFDSQSWLSTNPSWTPCLPAADPSTITIADLITLALGQRRPLAQGGH
jgi:hypothetical protein